MRRALQGCATRVRPQAPSSAAPDDALGHAPHACGHRHTSRLLGRRAEAQRRQALQHARRRGVRGQVHGRARPWPALRPAPPAAYHAPQRPRAPLLAQHRRRQPPHPAAQLGRQRQPRQRRRTGVQPRARQQRLWVRGCCCIGLGKAWALGLWVRGPAGGREGGWAVARVAAAQALTAGWQLATAMAACEAPWGGVRGGGVACVVSGSASGLRLPRVLACPPTPHHRRQVQVVGLTSGLCPYGPTLGL
jgi:hypothetical protein